MVSNLLNGHHTDLNSDDTIAASDQTTAPQDLKIQEAPIQDPQMVERASRRRFTNAYKVAILQQVDACHDRGEVGALLRREGLFYSTLANFRKQKASGLLNDGPSKKNGTSKKPRASKDPSVVAALAKSLELERENRKLRRQLARAEEIITIQKKAAILLGETLQDLQIGDDED